MLQKGLFRVVGMVDDMATQLVSDFSLFRAGLGKNGIDNLGHLPTQGRKVRFAPAPLLEAW